MMLYRTFHTPWQGDQPRPNCTAEEMALNLCINVAEDDDSLEEDEEYQPLPKTK